MAVFLCTETDAKGKQKLIQTGERAQLGPCPGGYRCLENYSWRPNQRGHLSDSLSRLPFSPLGGHSHEGSGGGGWGELGAFTLLFLIFV